MLSGADVAEARQHRGDGNRLCWSLPLCGLRMLEFRPDDVTMAPACRPDALVFSPLMLLSDHARHIKDNERATAIKPAHANVGGPQVTGPQPTGPQPTQIQAPTGPDIEHAHEQQPEPQASDRER